MRWNLSARARASFSLSTAAGCQRSPSTGLADAAACGRPDWPRPGFNLFERVATDLLVGDRPELTRCPVDRPACRLVQLQVRRSWWSPTVEDVPFGMIGEPVDVALVVIHEL